LLGQAASDEAARKRMLTVRVRADIASTIDAAGFARRRHGYATATKATEFDEREIVVWMRAVAVVHVLVFIGDRAIGKLVT
jgi:hypothetical protein